MVRKLKFHEQKLLKKVDFLNVRHFLVIYIFLFFLLFAFLLQSSLIFPLWQWKADASHREVKVMRRYHIQDREDYHKCAVLRPQLGHCINLVLHTPCRYNKLCGSLRSYVHRLSILPAEDPFRSKMEVQLLSKLYDMGVLDNTAKLSDVENKLTVAAFCRRRLAVFMCMSKMAETVSAVCKSRFPIALRELIVIVNRQSSSLSKATFESALTPSRIQLTLSQGKHA